MDKIDVFDVLVVYDSKIASGINSPFPNAGKYKKYNDVYPFFLSECSEKSINAAFATTNDIINSGTCTKYWIFKNNRWTRIYNACYSSLIFDKFSFTNSRLRESYNLLFSSNRVKPYKD